MSTLSRRAGICGRSFSSLISRFVLQNSRSVDMNTTSSPVLSEPFVVALKADREGLNARFTERRLAGRQVDAGTFLEHLASVVDPIVRGVAAAFPERTRVAVRELYELSLDLFGASLLGSRAKLPQVDALWRKLLPSLGKLLAREPARLAASLSNAAYNLAQQPDARPDWWTEELREISADCGSVEELLECGKVLAWRAGMAQYRLAALKTARNLAPVLAARVLRLPRMTLAEQLPAVLDRLKHDPWLPAEQAAGSVKEAKTIAPVRTVGAFRGFGGAFLRPPKVTSAEGRLWVGDSESFWQLQADVYGWHLQRCGVGAGPASQGWQNIEIDHQGTVRWQELTARFPDLAEATSFACDGTTLAVTVPTSHHVFLLARR